MFCRFPFHRKDNEMKEMSIDLETYSDVNITKCGAYKYAESDEFEVLKFFARNSIDSVFCTISLGASSARRSSMSAKEINIFSSCSTVKLVKHSKAKKICICLAQFLFLKTVGCLKMCKCFLKVLLVYI